MVMWVRADGKGVSTGTIVAIVIVPIVLLALGFAIWRRRKSHKASITTASEFPQFFIVQRQIKTYVVSLIFICFQMVISLLQRD